jgi:hypothetical protein
MKVVILARGRGTRPAEETATIPKPMVKIGGRPILWHIMRLYAHFGLTDFVVCLGYKGHVIMEYFANYLLHGSDVTVDLGANRIDDHNRTGEDWRVTLGNTGDDASPLKQGHRMPGCRIPIVPPDHLLAARPDHLLVLPWNIAGEIMEATRFIGAWGGRFVVPSPTLCVIAA